MEWEVTYAFTVTSFDLLASAKLPITATTKTRSCIWALHFTKHYIPFTISFSSNTLYFLFLVIQKYHAHLGSQQHKLILTKLQHYVSDKISQMFCWAWYFWISNWAWYFQCSVALDQWVVYVFSYLHLRTKWWAHNVAGVIMHFRKWTLKKLDFEGRN